MFVDLWMLVLFINSSDIISLAPDVSDRRLMIKLYDSVKSHMGLIIQHKSKSRTKTVMIKYELTIPRSCYFVKGNIHGISTLIP